MFMPICFFPICRVGSLVVIRTKDINFKNAVISLNITKNRKPLLMLLSNTLVEVLNEYMSIRSGDVLLL